jgi:mono/diheme cytochrome c family protein
MTRTFLWATLCLLGIAACGDSTVGDDGGGAASGPGGAGGTAGAGGSLPDEVAAVLALQGDPANGQVIYASLCGTSACHGANGNDGSVNAADHPEVVPLRSDASIVSTMLYGLGSMPAQSQLSAQEMADELAYLRITYP